MHRFVRQARWVSTPAQVAVRHAGRHFSASTSNSAGGDQTVNELRSLFLNYYSQKQGHTLLPSSSVIPTQDPTLLFTNAGMVQFKNNFTGTAASDCTKATTSQKCIRAGGKHNDLDNVGHTARHHTFFEMLGNFSFGAYFKEEAICMAWDFLIKEVQLPKDKLSFTVHHTDEESATLWRKIAGVSDSKISRLGDEDNFWTMGEGAGPCGPCSEIFWDQGREIDGERHLEIWNLVFMNQQRVDDGKGGVLPEMVRIGTPCVDTGMGLERLASVVQGRSTNYETEAFTVLFEAVRSLLRQRGVNVSHAAIDDVNNVAMRVIADHARACVIMVSDGVLPSNTGRGYVLRRILRRALRFGHTLGLNSPFLCELQPVVEASLARALPELTGRAEVVRQVLRMEEEAFFGTLTKGLKVFEDEMRKLGAVVDTAGDTSASATSAAASLSSSATKDATLERDAPKEVPGWLAFKLHDTFGFPFDLTRIVASDSGLGIDEAGFDVCMEEQRQRARANWKGSGGGSAPVAVPQDVVAWGKQGIDAEFVGYDSLLVDDAKVVALCEMPGGSAAWIAVSPCPFYPEGGGQVGDIGTLTWVDANGRERMFDVLDTRRPYEGGHALLVASSHDAVDAVDGNGDRPEVDASGLLSGLVVGATVRAAVSPRHRQRTAAHHTATHIVNAALRKVLGSTVTQAGSHVNSQRLRFDFSHGAALTADELVSVQAEVDIMVELDSQGLSADVGVGHGAVVGLGAVTVAEMPINAALESGAVAFFGDKYGETVRVVDIQGIGSELCGGTHVSNASQCAPILILGESSIAAGTRRLEAVAGATALALLRDNRAGLATLCKALDVSNVNVGDRGGVIEKVERLKTKLETSQEARRHAEKAMLKFAVSQAVQAPVCTHRVRQGMVLRVVRFDDCIHNDALFRTAVTGAAGLLSDNEAVLAISSDAALVGLAVSPSTSKATGFACGKLVGPLFKSIGAKGGGNATIAIGRRDALTMTASDPLGEAMVSWAESL